MNGKDLYERFCNLLEEKGMSKSEFCKKSGVGMSALSNWNARGSMPSADLSLTIARTLNVSVDYVLGNTNSSDPSANAEFSDDEKRMIKTFRELNDDSQRQLILMMAFLKEQNKK